jgi:hypothetical protein
MIKIDNTLLQEIGLGTLPDHEKDSLLKHIYETLEMRVGMRLADQMSNQQLDEFEQYFEAKDDAGAFKWLESNFPNYKDVVQEEFDKLKSEVHQAAPQILATASQQQHQGVPPQAPPNQTTPPPADPYQSFATNDVPQGSYQPPAQAPGSWQQPPPTNPYPPNDGSGQAYPPPAS